MSILLWHGRVTCCTEVKGFPILVTMRWARSWSRCSGSRPARDHKSSTWRQPTGVGCRYFPPGVQLPSQSQSITYPWPVPSYTAWWQRHIGENNLPKVVTQLLPRVTFEPTRSVPSAHGLIWDDIHSTEWILWIASVWTTSHGENLPPMSCRIKSAAGFVWIIAFKPMFACLLMVTAVGLGRA